MSVRCIHLFDTPLGRCAIAWSAQGIVGVQLPEAVGRERSRMLQRFPDAIEVPPPRDVQDAIQRITSLLEGAAADLGPIALDMRDVPEFDRLVYAAARRIPRGATRSYGEIAAEIGDPGSARAVGAALGRNPFPIVVPCHRVLAAAGWPGGFSAHGGVRTKMRMLEIEGAPGNKEFNF